MTPERWRQIEELFHTALERGAGERTALLASACANDTQLRQEVEALLASYEEAGDFIEEAPMAGAISSVADETAARTAQGASRINSLIGRKIGHYEIQSLLGAGGMGEVYLAHDLKLDRRIAVKILPAETDAAQVQRFEREARAASALNHPNIITIHEIGRDEETHFIATELVAGQTLREKITSGAIDIKEALSIAAQTADALAAAHAAGIVHRDIKPENVMVRPDGLVKVLDFGLAKPAAREPAPGGGIASIAVTMQTDPAMLMGTIAYLSPEQARRQRVDHRTDIFSLGVVLYELVTGSRPFNGASAVDILEAILRNEPNTIDRADAPQELKRIIARALEKDRAARYQTADGIRSDLQQLLRKANDERAGLSSVLRSKTALAVAAAVVIMAVALAGVLRRGTAPQAESFSTGTIRRITSVAGHELFPSLSPDGQAIVYASRVEGTWDIYLQKVGEANAVNLTPDSRGVDLAPAFSPDGRRIAFHSSRQGSGIFLIDADGRNLSKLSDGGHNPAWSPDGREIAFAEDRIFDYEGRNHSHSRLFAVDVESGARRLITTGDAVQPRWSPRGHRIAFWGLRKGGQRDIWTVAASGGEPIAVTDDEAVDWNPVWSPDGRHLYFLSDRGGSMNLWRVAVDEMTGAVTGQFEPTTLPSASSQHLSFSADGRALVYVEMNRRENAWQVAFDPGSASVAGQHTQITRGARRYSNPEISPDEKLLAFVSQGEAQEDVFIIDRDGSQLRQLTNDRAQDRNPRWSPGNRQIAFLSDRSGKYEIWKVNEDGSGLDQLTDAAGANVFGPVWSPDGKHLLYQTNDLNSFIIEVGKPLAAQMPQPLPGQQPPGFLPWSWSPDGKQLAGWQVRHDLPDMNIIIYSFASGRYERFPYRGSGPIWLNDNRRLIFADLGKMCLLDTLTGKRRELYSVAPASLGRLALSNDNRRLYYSILTSEADIWLVSLD
jgi:Tol biopolymer transport system component/serine/threonine protein kinase